MYAQIAFPIPLEKDFTYRIPEEFKEKILPGVRVVVPFGRHKERGYVVDVLKDTTFSQVKDILQILDDDPVVTGNLFDLARWLSQSYVCSMGEALNCIFPLSLNKNIVMEDMHVHENTRDSDKEIPDKILKALKKNEHQVFVITETQRTKRIDFYINVIGKSINTGECILLVPEITYIEEIANRIRGEFGNILGTWHSRIHDSERYRIWSQARKGNLKVVVGTRSAVFMPFTNLKLLIIDEESDQSYKNPQKPFFETVNVAAEYGRLSNSAVIIGGSMMSLDSYYRTKNKQYTEIKDKRSEPLRAAIKIIEKKKNEYLITEQAVAEIKERLVKNELSILFLNRRGYSKVVMCQDCKSIMRCPNCNISMGFHADIASFKCHYCKHTQKETVVCPSCGKKHLKFVGTGTQQVEEYLKALLPQAKIYRVDLDTIKNESEADAFINEIKKGNVDLVIATQVIFPFLEKLGSISPGEFTFAGICDVDSLLSIPDYRAAEKTFQLVYRLSTFLNKKGLMIIETNSKKNDIFKWLGKLNWKSFFEEELELRSDLNYPPVDILINIVIRGRDKLFVDREINRLYEYFSNTLDKDILVLGPDEPFHSKLRGEFRQRILLKASRDKYPKLSRDIKSFHVKVPLHMAVDVNPYDII